jgi:RES domain-containing protein
VFEPLNTRELTACRTAGQVWAETAKEPAVQVRSVVIPEEFNVLVNPRHRQYDELVWSNPRPFQFDSRLFTFYVQP